jgi:DNA/RNA-binding domain of Phe-tRNA-synthetase-like protein
VSAFQYHPEIVKRYPNLIGGIILASGMTNGPTSPALLERFLVEQRAALARIGDTPLSEVPALAAWRGALRSFGVDPTTYRSAPEALLRRLTKKGDIPSINSLVDIGNLISIRYGLAVAVFDVRAVQGTVTVRLADGSERFTPLFETAVENPEPGEVVFADDSGLALARRWCWRQSDQSASRDDTTDAIITIEAHHAGGRDDCEKGLADSLALLGEYSGGDFKPAVLDSAHPAISV